MPEPTLPLAASLLVTVSAAAAVLAAAALGAVLYALAGRRSAGRPGADGSVADGSVAGELRAIGAQIEQSIAEQRHQGETQRRLLTQKLDGLRETVDTQGHEVGGLRNELRHEVRRRDAELDEIRHQLDALRAGGALPAGPAAAALPAHTEPSVRPFSGDGSADVSVDALGALSRDAAPPALDLDPFDLTHVEAPVDVEADCYDAEDDAGEADVEAETVGPLAFGAASGDGPHDGADGGAASEDQAAPEPGGAAPSASGIFTPISFDAPAPPPAAWIARTDRPDAPGPVDADEAVASAFAAPPRPAGAEDLTGISSIDEATQAALYAAGVLTLDDVARIGRGTARRLSDEIGVPEHTVMNQWVFEAQAVLFDRFTQETQA